MVRVLLMVPVLMLLFSALGCGQPPRPGVERGNIVFIVIDTLRWDHLSCYGYERETSPNLDRLAREGVLFERAYSHSPWTMPSVASMFTSLPPRDHGIANWRQPLEPGFLTLAEYLKEQHGYRTLGYVSHMIFEPRYHFDQGFDVYDFDVLKRGYVNTSFSSDYISDRAIEVLEQSPTEPFFMWLHYFDPHNDYLKHEGFDFGDDEIARYDSEIAFTDHHIGRVLATLEATGLDARTVVVVVSDHGEEFNDHGGIYHSTTLYEELIHVPLLIRAPGLVPRRDRGVVAGIDIAPTLLDLVGLPVPPSFRGVGLTQRKGSLYGQEDRSVIAETYRFADKRGVVAWPYKLIADREEHQWTLFDLVRDPGETEDLVAEEPGVRDELLTTLDDHYAAQPHAAPETEMSDETREKLESLGYLQ